MIFAYACELPNNIFYPLLMKYVDKYGQSPKELERKAAIKVLGQVADPDSCLDHIKENIEPITLFIVNKL